jgi:hypothetical protein
LFLSVVRRAERVGVEPTSRPEPAKPDVCTLLRWGTGPCEFEIVALGEQRIDAPWRSRFAFFRAFSAPGEKQTATPSAVIPERIDLWVVVVLKSRYMYSAEIRSRSNGVIP